MNTGWKEFGYRTHLLLLLLVVLGGCRSQQEQTRNLPVPESDVSAPQIEYPLPDDCDPYMAKSVLLGYFGDKDGKYLPPITHYKNYDTQAFYFDLYSSKVLNVVYRVYLCNSQWKIVNNSFAIDTSLREAEIFQVQAQENLSYVTYKLLLQKTDFEYPISIGITAYERETGKRLFSSRLILYDTIIVVNAQIVRSPEVKYEETHHAIRPEILHIPSEYRGVWLSVVQNGRWDRWQTNIMPSYIIHQRGVFSPINFPLFPAGKPFRTIDVRFHSVDTFRAPVDMVRAHMGPDFMRSSLFGGMDIIPSGHYVPVEFTLRGAHYKEPVIWHSAVFQWQPIAKMHFADSSYKKVILLKQGRYDYIYANVLGSIPDEGAIEGNNIQTVNKYWIIAHSIHPSLNIPLNVGFKEIVGNLQ
ncbi:MAG: DUF5103 domain-containing protein [Chlorobi bacterium]|nr:DUF5103 domain-containing protein [Chlorobiota bacterium]